MRGREEDWRCRRHQPRRAAHLVLRPIEAADSDAAAGAGKHDEGDSAGIHKSMHCGFHPPNTRAGLSWLAAVAAARPTNSAP